MDKSRKQPPIILDEIDDGVWSYHVTMQTSNLALFASKNYLSVNNPSLAPANKSPSDFKSSSVWEVLKPQYKSVFEQAIIKFVNINDLAKQKKSLSWSNLMEKLRNSINNSDSEQNLISNAFWMTVFDKFQPYTLSKEQKLTFIKLMKKYFNSNSQKDKKDSQTLFRTMGNNFLQLELDLYFRHKSYISYAQFISIQANSLAISMELLDKGSPLKFYDLSFDMSENESKRMVQTVKKLCKNNLDAFSFVSLYFLKALEIQLLKIDLNKTKEQFNKVEEQFLTIIKILKNYHLPKDRSSKDKLSSETKLPEILSIEQDKKLRKNKEFTKGGETQQLIAWIHEKILQAQLDFNQFQKLSAHCVNGINFKSCLKIKNGSQQYSIMRIIEKLLEDHVDIVKNPKYKVAIENLRQSISSLHAEIQSKSSNILKDLVNAQIEQISTLVNKIISEQKSITWNIKDLLRGKCTFNCVEDIYQTYNNLTGKGKKQKKKKQDKEKNRETQTIKTKQKNNLFNFKQKMISKKQDKSAQRKGTTQNSDELLPSISTALNKGTTGYNEVSKAKIKRTNSMDFDEEDEESLIAKFSSTKQKIKKLSPLFNQSIPKNSELMKEQKNVLEYESATEKPKKKEQQENECENQSGIKYKIIQTKNRLSKPESHDFVIILEMENGTIAQLQLALNQNSFAYEFDHKFYELKRSSLFTPITNLCLCHSKWSNQFFIDFIENFNKMAKGPYQIDGNIDLKKYQDDVSRFETDIQRYKQSSKDKFEQLLADKQAEFIHTKSRFDQLFQNKRTVRDHKLKIPRNEEQQLKNELNFLLGLRDYKRAKQMFEYANETIVMGNPKLRQLYAEVLMEYIFYCQMDDLEKSIWIETCIQQLQELEKLYNSKKTMREKENVCKMMGRLYLNSNISENSKKAEKYFTEAISLRKAIDQLESAVFNGSNLQKLPSQEEAETLLQLGCVLLNQKDKCNEAKKNFLKSQQIYKQNRKVDCIEMAKVYLWMGKCIQEDTCSYSQSAQIMFSNSLEIIKKNKGQNSIEVAEVLQSISDFLLEQRQLEDAYQMSKKACEIYTHLFGNDDLRTKASLKFMKRAAQKTYF